MTLNIFIAMITLQTRPRSQQDSATTEWDWIAVMKYASTEPSWSTFSSEQTQDAGWTNTAPSFSSESPTGTTLLQPDASVTINDEDGNDTTVDWYISTDNSTWGSPSRHVASHTANTSDSYTVSEATSLDTTYYIKVTANDGHDNSTAYWSFTTLASQGNSSGFGGMIVVQSTEANISLSPGTFGFGTVSYNTTDNTTGTYFTLTNEGSSTIKVNITVNDSNDWTYVAFADRGTDVFSMNFTTDNWSTETNIAPADPPSTSLSASLSASESVSFGLRLIMPLMGTTTAQQSLTVWITGEVV